MELNFETFINDKRNHLEPAFEGVANELSITGISFKILLMHKIKV